MAERGTSRTLLSLEEAARVLDLPPDAVLALVAGQFLPASVVDGPPDEAASRATEPLFRLVDLKAFLARNADFGGGNLLELPADDPDPQALLDDLDARSEDMARRAFDIFATAIPEARGWSLSERARFINQAKSRFEAILAVTGHGAEVDEALVDDLQEVGAAAAWAQSPLPQLLMVLRISRDLVVQTAVELAEERGQRWGLALSLLLTRVLPAMDRLIDALATGYWSAVVKREEAASARYAHVVEHSSDGVWEVDLDGRISYANAAFALIVGHDLDELDGVMLTEVLPEAESGLSLDALTPGSGAAGPFEVSIRRPDGVRRVLAVRVLPRYEDDQIVGFQGVARDTTALHALEAEKNEFLALVTHDLRNPLSTIVGMGATLETMGQELNGPRIRRMGEAIRRQAERISRLADDLYDVSRLEASSLLLSPRPVDLLQVVQAALDTVDPSEDIAAQVEVRVDPGVTVLADPRRLEQVVANLVSNAFEHGAPPVVIEVTRNGAASAGGPDGHVTLRVVDHGSGVPPAVEPVLFSRVHTLTRHQRSGRVGLGTGLGLFLVKGLVEAMGGRVSYEGSAEGASFEVVLMTPRRPADALVL
ncbi:MAG TPA: ATP-binding protein [Acidimicrobiales bacterium]|nr:ATP-binding protein [Acidimicrobiales bacterium]